MSTPINRRKFLSRTVQTTGVAFAMQSFVARGALAASGDGRRRGRRCDGDYGDLNRQHRKIPVRPCWPCPKASSITFSEGQARLCRTADRRRRPTMEWPLSKLTMMGVMMTWDDDRRGQDRRKHRNRLITLVRNHEILFRTPAPLLIRPNAYDPTTGGGTTTLIVDAETRLPVRSFVSISGTHNNCAGGATPWGSWITCEENVSGLARGFSKPHGYAFEVSAKSTGPVDCGPAQGHGALRPRSHCRRSSYGHYL